MRIISWTPSAAQINRRVRSITPNNPKGNLPNDGIMLALLQRWLDHVVLATRPYHVPFDDGNVYQFESLQPNLHAYVIHLNDPQLLRTIVQQSATTPVLAEWWDRIGSKASFPFASFFFLRRIVPHRAKDTDAGGFALREIYWLVIYQAAGPLGQQLFMAFPALEVTDDSMTFYRPTPPRTAAEADDQLSDIETGFLDPGSALIYWHDLATAMG